MHTRAHTHACSKGTWGQRYLFGLGLQALKIIGDIFQLLLKLSTLTAPGAAILMRGQNGHRGRGRGDEGIVEEVMEKAGENKERE